MDQERGRLARQRHHPAEIVFASLAFAAAVFLASQLGTALTWKAGQPLARQPGLFSAIAIAGMLLFGSLELFSIWRRQTTEAASALSEVGCWLKAVEYAVWFMAYVALVPWLGYLPSTLVFSALLTFRLGYPGWRPMLSALAVGLATVVIFKSFLAVKIPGGVVYDYLPDVLRNFMILYL